MQKDQQEVYIMATAPTLYCKKRELSTKGYLNKMKKDGWIPGVVYGKEKSAKNILLEAKEVKRVFSHSGTRGVIMLEIEGEKSPVMALIRELQKSPVGDEYIHIDFLPLKSNEKVHNVVSIHLLGEDELIEQGKVLQVMTKQMEVSCLPADIPENITVDLTALDNGDKVVMGDISLPANVELLHDPSTVICIVMARTRTAEEPEAKVAEEAAKG
jgi:large subunit ribosomal protein L25